VSEKIGQKKLALLFCMLFITIYNMKLLMDSDCLIKITKAGLKECMVQHFHITLPKIVEVEVVDSGMVKNLPDAIIVRENIKQKKLHVDLAKKYFKNGDEAVCELYDHNKFKAVATDDAKLIKFLHSLNIPYIVPAALLYSLFKHKKITKQKCLEFLNKLKPFINIDEYSSVRILLEV